MGPGVTCRSDPCGRPAVRRRADGVARAPSAAPVGRVPVHRPGRPGRERRFDQGGGGPLRERSAVPPVRACRGDAPCPAVRRSGGPAEVGGAVSVRYPGLRRGRGRGRGRRGRGAHWGVLGLHAPATAGPRCVLTGGRAGPLGAPSAGGSARPAGGGSVLDLWASPPAGPPRVPARAPAEPCGAGRSSARGRRQPGAGAGGPVLRPSVRWRLVTAGPRWCGRAPGGGPGLFIDRLFGEDQQAERAAAPTDPAPWPGAGRGPRRPTTAGHSARDPTPKGDAWDASSTARRSPTCSAAYGVAPPRAGPGGRGSRFRRGCR